MEEIQTEAERAGWLQSAVRFPGLDRDDRVELVQRLEEGATADWDFVMMMVLAAALASFGLIEDSTAVVIGAMLVAPLMGPLVAAGLALNQANMRLFRLSMQSTVVGLGLGFGISVAVGLLNPGFEPSLEIESRGKPDLFDLGIALASGMAGAYALGRPRVASTLAGVAIAAALVPPLAVVGIALTNERPIVAGNAAILLVTNLVVIILGASLIFRMLRAHTERTLERARMWGRRATVLLVMLAMILVAPLLLNQLELHRTGQARPLTYPAAPQVRRAVRAFVEDWPGVDVILMGRVSVEPELGVVVVVSSERALPRDFEAALERAVHAARGDTAPVRVFALLDALEDEPPPFEPPPLSPNGP